VVPGKSAGSARSPVTSSPNRISGSRMRLRALRRLRAQRRKLPPMRVVVGGLGLANP